MIPRGQYPRVGTSAFGQPDPRQIDFLSYCPPLAGNRPGMEELRVPLEPDRVTRPAIGLDHFQTAFPLQPGKVQRPLLPESTLRRDRLLGWLADHADRRIVYVIAEAGFGKTTLVADYTRRSRFRTFWYRLDDGDTDGLVFLRYLIAACQAVDPRLLSRASALLSEASIEPLRQETVLEATLAELESLGEVPSVLVLDDLHTAEESASLREVVERIIARAPGHLKVIVLSRRTPMLSVAAIRARGELAELARDELRFDESETGRLFSESYQHTLDADVIRELQVRTDGWAASLGLVGTAVEGRSAGQVRSFVNSLSGAEGSLYDYVAEEVVGELPQDLRRFLLRVVLLEEIDAENAALAAGVSSSEARRLIAEAQRLSLLARGDGLIGAWRAHPLVRDFLVSHLESEVGPAGVAAIHRHLASLLERTSWRLAARHWAAAGEAEQVRRVICNAVPAIIGTGDLTAAADLIGRFPDPSPNPWYDIIRSRQSAADGRYDEALKWAHRAVSTAEELPIDDPYLATASALNLLFLGVLGRDRSVRAEAFSRLNPCDDDELSAIAVSARLLSNADEDGSLAELCTQLRATARLNQERGHHRYEGITLLNLAECEMALGHQQLSLDAALRAIRHLEATGDGGDLAAAHASAAKSLFHSGRLAEGVDHSRLALASSKGWSEPSAVVEIAELDAMYGDPHAGARILRELEIANPSLMTDPRCCLVQARLRLVLHKCPEIDEAAFDAAPHSPMPGFRNSVRALSIQAQAQAHPDDPSLAGKLDQALALAEQQQAWFWWRSLRLTRALTADARELSESISALVREDAAYLSIQAELVVRRLADLDPHAFEVVRAEAELRPERWRWALRQVVDGATGRSTGVQRCAALLELVGEASDVALLRGLAHRKALRIPDAGRALSRKLATPAVIEDLGCVNIRVGTRTVHGTDIRKKVLSLLTYLLTRPQFAASREQVIEALWPDMAPDQGANSLNQTAYFLRRVFEPGGDDETTAGYLGSRGDLMWLDPELVTSQSAECLKLIAKARRSPSPDVISQLAEMYTGRFAIDFLYDDWATSFRETLHSSYLDRIERALELDVKAGAFERAVAIAQLALQADPDAEEIELRLLRLYRVTGAHAAAAELYAHYSTTLREQLGVEPPPLESI